MVALIVIVVVVVFALVVAARTIRVIPQARAGVVERLGRYSRTLEPGLTIVTPFIDRVKPLVDLREQVVNFAPQSVITEDNVVVGIETVLYFTITDPRSATYEIANPLQAIEQLTVTTLRNVIGGLTLEATLTARENVNTELRVVLDEATGKWGIRINRVEIKSVDPPADIRTAMEKQMRAERDRRAAILTAEGEKQAQILTAEGEAGGGADGRGRPPGRDPARRGRSEGDRHGLQSDPRGQTEPGAAELRIPADAPPARRRRREQGVRGAVRVRPGVRRHRRGAGAVARPVADSRPLARRRRPSPRTPDAQLWRPGQARRLRESGVHVRLARREAAGNALRCAQPRHPDRAGHRRRDARDPPRAAGGGRQLQGRQAVHRPAEGALSGRGGHRQAERRPAGGEDRRGGVDGADGRRVRRPELLPATADGDPDGGVAGLGQDDRDGEAREAPARGALLDGGGGGVRHLPPGRGRAAREGGRPGGGGGVRAGDRARPGGHRRVGVGARHARRARTS